MSSILSDGSNYGFSLNLREKCRYRCCHGAVMITLTFDEPAEITLFHCAYSYKKRFTGDRS